LMMAASIPRLQILALYKNLLRESAKFTAYNYRLYFLRRVKDGFREGRALTDASKISGELDRAQRTLESLKRQAVIQNMFSSGPLVIEK